MASPTLDTLAAQLTAAGLAAAQEHGTLILVIPAEAVRPTALRLKSEFGFDLFLDVTAVDWPNDPLRFEIVYHFYSTTHRVRVRVKTRVAADNPTVDTLVPLYGAAHFMERECHEMYGIVFRGNDDLRPILLYEGFQGNPLRKDFPKEREQPLVPYRK